MTGKCVILNFEKKKQILNNMINLKFRLKRVHI